MSCKSDYYNHTSKEFRELFKKECKKSRKKFVTKNLEASNSLHQLVLSSFFWHATEDGLDFWANIYENLLEDKKYLKKWTKE